VQYSLIIEDRNGLIADELAFDQGSFTVGRAEGVDIQLASNAVSREHARLFTQDGRCFIADLNSSNGVFVDGNRIFGTQEIVAGSQIRVGDFLLLLKTRSSAARPAQAPAPSPPSHNGLPQLIRIGDLLKGETFSLTEQHTTLGRTEDNTILLPDASVSRRHATISSDGGRYVVVDSGSSNGTRLNGQLVNQPTLLSPGDMVRFGNVRFVFAGPGQQIDLSEYRKFLRGSNRALVIAVTVLALLLLLVASGIGAFVLMENDPSGTSQEDAGETVTNEERARTLKAEGDERASVQDWNGAIPKYQLALDFDPTFTEAADALANARAEFDAKLSLDEAEINIAGGAQNAREGNYQAAVTAYEQAAALLQSVPPTSQYAEAAQGQLSHDIDPSLARFHRELGDASLLRGEYPEAVRHYQSVIGVFETHSGPETPGLTRENKETFRVFLINSAGSVIEAGQAGVAVQLFDLANRLGELRRSEREALFAALASAASQSYEAEDYGTAARLYQRAQEYGQLSRRQRRQLDNAVERAQN